MFLVQTRVVEASCDQCAARVVPDAQRRVTPGKPFEECPGCDARVARGFYSEWDTMSAGVKARNVGHCLFWAVLIGLLTGSTYTLWTMVLGDGADRMQVAIAFALGFLVSGSWRAYWLAEAIQRSRRRMSDPMYTARLVKFELERLEGALAPARAVPASEAAGRVGAD
ncbi:MAG: hypothetical protein ACI8QZ_002625 [Chlamydiales bacterium]